MTSEIISTHYETTDRASQRIITRIEIRHYGVTNSLEKIYKAAPSSGKPRGSFTNYTEKFLGFFGHLPKEGSRMEGTLDVGCFNLGTVHKYGINPQLKCSGKNDIISNLGFPRLVKNHQTVLKLADILNRKWQMFNSVCTSR